MRSLPDGPKARSCFAGFDTTMRFTQNARQAAPSTTSSPAAVWDVVTSLGGKTRYFYMNWIWTLREFMDWLVGGPGLTRGRRDAGDLRLGDTIDYWTVIGLDPGRRLTLDFGLEGAGRRHSRIRSRALARRMHAGHGHCVLASAGRVGPPVLGGAGSVSPFHIQGNDARDRAPRGSAGHREGPTARSVTRRCRRSEPIAKIRPSAPCTGSGAAARLPRPGGASCRPRTRGSCPRRTTTANRPPPRGCASRCGRGTSGRAR